MYVLLPSKETLYSNENPCLVLITVPIKEVGSNI